MNYSNSQRAGVILYLAASLFGGYFGIKDSLVYSTEDINYEKIINYNIVSKNVDKLANSSKQWLIKALDETNL